MTVGNIIHIFASYAGGKALIITVDWLIRWLWVVIGARSRKPLSTSLI